MNADVALNRAHSLLRLAKSASRLSYINYCRVLSTITVANIPYRRHIGYSWALCAR